MFGYVLGDLTKAEKATNSLVLADQVVYVSTSKSSLISAYNP